LFVRVRLQIFGRIASSRHSSFPLCENRASRLRLRRFDRHAEEAHRSFGGSCEFRIGRLLVGAAGVRLPDRPAPLLVQRYGKACPMREPCRQAEQAERCLIFDLSSSISSGSFLAASIHSTISGIAMIMSA